ncbi:methyltransferase domain-containing protein [Streptomyces chumphonensis]|uniref:methyltransferase domain-containing protein n=1 Tax=Streptomyces chumphonensis TaxID=1214925 RepID=UPI003D74DF44
MTTGALRDLRPGRAALGRLLLDAGALSPPWLPVFAAVDRADFLPDEIWPWDMERRAGAVVDRAADPDGWYAAADGNAPVVTQWDDGEHAGPEPGRVASSSSSAPSVVYAMLADAAPAEDMAVLDVGTGTGETAAALAHRCVRGRVTTVEVDRAVSDAARARLRRRSPSPTVVVGDGAAGHAAGAPYDRVLATVGLRAVPAAWVAQTRPGGVIVAPWGTHFGNADAVVRLVVGRGVASGRFMRPVEFMKLRAQRLPARRHEDRVPADTFRYAATSTTDVVEDELVTGRFTALPFALGLRVRACVQAVAERRGGARPVWFYGTEDRSWACVLFRAGGAARVWQSGPRRLWDEVEAAYRWWREAGRPDHTRFGLTVTPDGHRAWLDDPARSWPV